jgi:fatty aldehyde-generating acyl-ACP reductase
MDHKPARIKFAVIGHQDSWDTVMRFVKALRFDNRDELPLCKVQETFTYIPPRKLFDIEVNSTINDKINGVYIETFIAPDELDVKYLRKNIEKVRKACGVAAKHGALVVSLGGFSSIVLEMGNQFFTNIDNTHFTTGNTLTAAFIAKGVEKACELWKTKLQHSNMLIIGSTGDIGTACVTYFSGKVRKLLLCARQNGPLQKQSDELSKENIRHTSSTLLKELVYKADIVISVATSIIDNEDFDLLPQHAIVCDAGYPKNLQSTYIKNHGRLFYGGMGLVTGGFKFENNAQDILYKFSTPQIAHGCLLESVVLALEDKYCAFSKGRGNITVKTMHEILEMAEKHGIKPAPLFNSSLVIEPTHKEKVYE